MTNNTRMCEAAECGRRHYARGWCNLHYSRWRTKGTIGEPRPRFRDPDESFSARTRWTDTGCLEWTASRDRLGYGRISVHGTLAFVHRYAWEKANGPIHEGMVLDHLCHNRSCANVQHLRMVTQAANAQNIQAGRRGSKSGIRGVSWNSQEDKWTVKVCVDGKFHFGGYFVDKEEAGLVAAEMRSRLMPYTQN